METADVRLSVYELILCLSQAVDLVSPLVADHHRRVSYIAYSIASAMGMPLEQQKQLAMAGALHDIGGLSQRERLHALRFEVKHPHRHAETGYRLLNTFAPFSEIARMVRFHHVPWNEGAGETFRRMPVPLESHILHLADRISVLIDPGQEILKQTDAICQRVMDQRGHMFRPELVDVFRELASREFFWFQAASPIPEVIPMRSTCWETIELNSDDFLGLMQLFRRIIDFKCPYTAAHSSGVAEVAMRLAEMVGFSPADCLQMKAAGYLHDLGKLGVPREILEKPEHLTSAELNVIHSHTYYTDRLLKPLAEMDQIREWSALHHERLDGSGYPFHYGADQISTGARLMAISDIFAALTENRPYRDGIPVTSAISILDRMVAQGKLDGDLVSVVRKNRRELDECRMEAQSAATEEYYRLLVLNQRGWFSASSNNSRMASKLNSAVY